jgi:hypothetical protein
MFRHSLILAAGVCAAALVPAARGDSLFDEPAHDFGPVPRGPTVTHIFRLTNRTGEAIHISGLRVSCGCVSASADRADVAPGQQAAVVADMDTRRFSGQRTVTIYVQLDRPRWEEERLSVRAESRDDVSLSPESFAFGQARRGSSPTASVDLGVLGGGDWRVVDAGCDSSYVKANAEEISRDGGRVVYRVTATLRPDTPIGAWYTDVWLNTTSAVAPRVRVPLTVEVTPSLSVSPSIADLGTIKKGAEAQQKVLVRGVKPFRITSVLGTDDRLSVTDASPESKQVHVLTIKLKGGAPGDLRRTLRLRTDQKDEGDVEFEATARVTP